MRIKKAEKMKNTLISLTNCRFLGLGKLNVRVKQEFYSYGISDLTEKKAFSYQCNKTSRRLIDFISLFYLSTL